MAQDGSVEQQPRELWVGDPQMVDPDGGIDEDHAVFRRACPRRLGIGRRVFSDPPSAARRLALSRATSASSPARTTAVFSRRPLNWVALTSSASSIFNVVRIYASVCSFDTYASIGSWQGRDHSTRKPRSSSENDETVTRCRLTAILADLHRNNYAARGPTADAPGPTVVADRATTDYGGPITRGGPCLIPKSQNRCTPG